VVRGDPAVRVGTRRPGGRAWEITGSVADIGRGDRRNIWVVGGRRCGNPMECSKIINNRRINMADGHVRGTAFMVEPSIGDLEGGATVMIERGWLTPLQVICSWLIERIGNKFGGAWWRRLHLH